MTIGAGGPYDTECEFVFAATRAEGCAVLVVGGSRGNGFSVSIRAPFHVEMARAMAKSLRDVAEQIEKDATVLQGKKS